MRGGISIKTITVDHYRVRMTLMTLRRSPSQRSRSTSTPATAIYLSI